MDTRLKQNIYCKQEMWGATTTPMISAHKNQWYYPMRRDRVTTTTYELRESMSLARWPHLAKEIRVSDDTEIYNQPHWPHLAIEINGSWCEYIQIDIDICIYLYNVTKTPLRLYTWTEPHFIVASPRPMTEYDTWLRIKHFKTHKETWKLWGLMHVDIQKYGRWKIWR